LAYFANQQAQRLKQKVKQRIMKNKNLSQELIELLHPADDLCITLILPLHEFSNEKKLDRIMISHTIDKLKQLLLPYNDPKLLNEFIGKLAQLKDLVLQMRGVKGIGVFMSKSVFRIISFPFEVTEKIQAGSSFEVRDILYRDIMLEDYRLLSIHKDGVRLYNGRSNTLFEIQDKNFPASYDAVEYQVPVVENQVNNAAQAMQRETSYTTESEREFYNLVDAKLSAYLKSDTPLVIAGTEKELAQFSNNTYHSSNICGKVTGSYERYNFQELEAKAWEAVEGHYMKLELRTHRSLAELFGRGLVSYGIEHVWREAKLGKGQMLVVERDLSVPAFKGEDEYTIWMRPHGASNDIITDAVDDIIEIVLEKDGKVMFVKNGLLAEYQGIALVKRYQ
jgi:hypothetical protein